MQNKDQGSVGNEGETAPVCAEAMDQLWQAAYGAVPGLAGVSEGCPTGTTSGLWRPYDAERPLMLLMRACIAHLDAAGHDAAARRHLQTRLFALSAWLCTNDARRASASLVAWAWEAGAWRLRAVHRDLVRHAATCASLPAALSALDQARPDQGGAVSDQQEACVCAATI